MSNSGDRLDGPWVTLPCHCLPLQENPRRPQAWTKPDCVLSGACAALLRRRTPGTIKNLRQCTRAESHLLEVLNTQQPPDDYVRHVQSRVDVQAIRPLAFLKWQSVGDLTRLRLVPFSRIMRAVGP